MWVAIWERVGRDVRGEKERERASPYRGPLGVQSPHRATEVRASGGSFCPIRPRHRKNKGEYTLARDGMASGRQHLQKTDVTAPKTREQQGHRSKTHKIKTSTFCPPIPHPGRERNLDHAHADGRDPDHTDQMQARESNSSEGGDPRDREKARCSAKKKKQGERI